jgi:exosortase
MGRPGERAADSGRRRDLLWIASIVAVAAVMYASTGRFLWQKWMENAQYSLAPIVPFVSGYFLWKKWPEVKELKRSPSVLGLVLILLAILLHLVGAVLDISGPSGVSIFLCILGGCLYFHSKALVRTLWFPLAYLAFMIPVPGGVLDLIGFPLQLWASGSTAAILRAFGMEVTRTGVNLSVPGFDFQVAEACSGMSSLVALFGVTAVFAYTCRLPDKQKWLLVFLALPIALAANIVRIITIALVGYEWGSNAAMNIYHDWSSPILFLVAICFMFAITGVLEWFNGRRNTA